MEGSAQQMDTDASVDYKICGELIERNTQLDEYAASQDPQGAIQVRV